VTGENVRQRAYREGVPAGDSGSQPGLVRKVAEEGDSGGTDRPEFGEMAGPRILVGSRRGHGNVLIEARKRRVESGGEPEWALSSTKG
jgi:hypothetical protein